jgi:hypothetical protein
VAILILLLWAPLLWPQDEERAPDPPLTASVDQDPAKFGSIVVLTLAYRLPDGGYLPEDLEIQGLEDLSTVGMETTPAHIRIKLLVDQSDLLQTGPLLLTYLDKEGDKQVLTADPISITVLSSLGERPEEVQLRPIQGIIPIKTLWLRYLPWGVGLLLVLLAGAGLFWWHRRGRFQTISAEVLDPPHMRARKEIEQLEGQRLFEQGQIKRFYFSFSEILRRYLEALRGFPAAEFTTEEIALHMDNEQDRSLLPLLRHADLVKFADTVPTPARKEEEVTTALAYIQETGIVTGDGLSGNGSQGVSR